MNATYIAFDIETEALSPAWIRSITKPYKAFAPDKIKIGDCRTPEALAAKLAAARAKYEEEEGTYYADAVTKGALAPETGRVLTIGYLKSSGEEEIDGPHAYPASLSADEAERLILSRFWQRWQELWLRHGLLVSWNGAGFDLPFLVTRSWILRVPVPQLARRGRYWHSSHIDLMLEWNCHALGTYTKLDLAAKCLGFPGKSGQAVSGADFAAHYRAGGEQREAALEYALRDIWLTSKIGQVLLGLEEGRAS